MTEDQLAENQYPLSPETDPGFLVTEDGAGEDKVKVIALDCEMVRTEAALELARVSLVNLSGDILYDAFVKPLRPVTDYLTQYSGITANTLQDIQLTMEQARAEVLKLVKKDTILCGHSLENDLRALNIIHKRVIDTSILFPHNAPSRKWSLKSLAQRYLRQSIQSVTSSQQKGHDSVEDARAALFLTREKVTYGIKFGIPHPTRVVENLFEVLSKYGRKTAIVGFAPERDLIQGNVTVDLTGKVEKYVGEAHISPYLFRDISLWFTHYSLVGGEWELVVSEWRQLVGTESVEEVLKQWEVRLKELISASPQNTGWVIATGEGDPSIYEKLQALKTEDTVSWTSEQEQSLHLAAARLKKTFGIFFFPGQLA